MNTTACPCARCERPVPDRLPLCAICGDGLVVTLLSVPSLVEALAVTRAGADRLSTGRDGGRSADAALPVRLSGRGAEMVGDRAYRRLETAVGTWARVLAETLREDIPIGSASLVTMVYSARESDVGASGLVALTHPPRARRPAIPFVLAAPVEQAAVWMASWPRELRTHEAAGEMAAEIEAAAAEMRRAVDLPVERRYLGPCDQLLADGSVCESELWAAVGDEWVRCRRCRAQWEVRRIEADALARVEDQLHPVADLVRILAGLGAPIARRTAFRWAAERRIQPRGWQHIDEHGRKRITDHWIGPRDMQVYRVGDARALAARQPDQGGSAA